MNATLPEQFNEQFSQQDVAVLNDFESYLSFIPTWSYRIFVNLPHKIIFLNSGNQALKTSSTAKQYVDRILGWHPVPKKNVVYWECEHRVKIHRNELSVDELIALGHKSKDSATWNSLQLPQDMKCSECGGNIVEHKRGSRTFRFASETLPGVSTNVSKQGASAEVKNTTYPEFKKWLPKFLIKKDITSRSASMIIKDIYGGADIVIDFVSYNQPPQGTAGPQRCVAKGQRVLKSSGVWTNIEDIKIGDELICETLGGYGSRQRVNKVADVIDNGFRNVYKVSCQKGITFETTADHLIMVPGRGKSSYKRLEQLTVGDSVKCKLSNIQGVKSLQDWKLILTAMIIGDGNTTGDQPRFSCKNLLLLAMVKTAIPSYIKLRGSRASTRPEGTTDYHISFIGMQNRLTRFFRSVGLWGKKAAEKFIPDIIFEQDNISIALFLKYLFATDGWASGHRIGYCSTSYRLTQDVFLLLRRLGVRSTITRKDFSNNWNTQWWVNISQAKDVLNFIDNIGIAGKDDYVGNVRREAKRRIKSRHNVCTFPNKGTDIKSVKRLSQSVKIKSIEHVGVKQVYDLTMEAKRTPLNNFLVQGGVVVHNCSIWEDEQPDMAFHEEQYPGRLVAEDGDLIISCTPADRISWLYDEVFEKAKVYYRTDAVIEAYARLCDRPGMKKVEFTNSPFDIAVIQAATDDNPTLVQSVIDDMYKDIDEVNHPETLAIRRYGIFKQISGRIFKGYAQGTHVINSEKYFPHGIPKDWTHARGIDYHPSNPWAFGCMSLSYQNELFIWAEMAPNPDNLVTLDICERLVKIGPDYKFRVNLIDPLANVKQPNTGYSTREDMNRIFHHMYKEGECKPTSWIPWDTKSQVGRDAIKTRLKNSVAVGKPFSNRIEKDGREMYLPTVWILDYCVNFSRSLKNWRMEEWANNAANQAKDAKETPQQKWSHFCMVIEGVLKHQGFRPPIRNVQRREVRKDKYFQGGARV